MKSQLGAFKAGFALLFAFTVVSGCAGTSTPSPSTPSPGEPPTDAPPPAEVPASPATVVIGAQSLIIRAEDGSVLQELPFTDDPATAITVLGEVFDSAPTILVSEAAECVHTEITATWGEEGFVIGHGPELPLPEDLQFHASTQAGSVGEVAIETPTGFTVGDSLEELVAATPDSETESAEFEGVLYERAHYEIQDTPTGQWGAFAWAEDDTIQGLAGGYFLTGDC